MSILVVLAIGCFVSAFSIRVVDPVVPQIARHFSITVATAALLVSAYTFPYALGQPALGWLGDALGKTRMIKIALVALAVLQALVTVAPDFIMLLAGRSLAGFASGAIIPLSFAIIGDRFAMEKRQLALSRVLMFMLVGQLLGATTAGFVGEVLGWRWVMGLTSALVFLACLVTLRSLHTQRDGSAEGVSLVRTVKTYRSVFANPKWVACYVGVLVEGVAIFGFMPLISGVLEARGAGDMGAAGLVVAGLGMGGLLYTFSAVHLLAHLGSLRMMRVGGSICALGLAALALTTMWPAQLSSNLVVGYGFFMLHNGLQTEATEIAPRARGAAVSLHALFFFFGQAIGPLVYQLAFALAGVRTALLGGASVILALGFWTAAILSRPQPRVA